jgi:hypothetical protein
MRCRFVVLLLLLFLQGTCCTAVVCADTAAGMLIDCSAGLVTLHSSCLAPAELS